MFIGLFILGKKLKTKSLIRVGGWGEGGEGSNILNKSERR